jgi:hypothetical protein
MGAVLVPDTLWGLIEPFLSTPLPMPRGGRPRLTDRACLAGRGCCRKDWVCGSGMLPAGGGCATGGRMEFGVSSISHCWTGFCVMVRSTGRVLSSTAVRCARFLGAADWAKSD